LSLEKVNIEEKLALFDEQWKPKIVAELNGQHVNVVKFLGELSGTTTTRRTSSSSSSRVVYGWRSGAGASGSRRGDLIVVPRGVEHRPVAEEEAHVLLFEPASTLNMGNVQGEMTVAELDRI
jgi:hypothetical protein